jgi:hypothetical protein
MSKTKQDLLLAAALIFLAVSFRTFLHLAANLEFVTSAAIAAGYFLKDRRLVFLVPLGIMLISDLIIGNDLSFIFTWSGFLAMPFLGTFIKNVQRKWSKAMPEYLSTLIYGEFAGIIASAWFFLWTNFGVVVISHMYTKDLGGLIQSYINALPFVRVQLAGNLILVPLTLVLIQMVLNWNNSRELKLK